MSSSTIDPVAQTFIIDGQNFPSGAFLSSVNLFFRTKPSTSVPVRLCILSTINGYPTGQPLEYSIVSLPSTSVNVSETPHYLNSNTYTNFAFSAPVYINPDQLYAIVVQSSSDDYTLWCSQQGDTALLSTSKALPTDVNPSSPTKIVTTPYVGDLFESQNGLTWTADLLKDLMFTINRCKFDTNTSPSMSFVVPAGLPQRRTIESDTSLATSNSIYDIFNLSTTDLTPPGTTLSYQYTTTLESGSSAIITNITASNISASGNISSSTLYVTNNGTINGDLTVNGGDIVLSNTATNISLLDNVGNALDIKEAANSYIKVATTDANPNVTFGTTPTVYVLKTTDNDLLTYDNGALQVGGGVGINKNLFVGANTYTVGNSSITGSLTVGTTLRVNGNSILGDALADVNTSSGSLRVLNTTQTTDYNIGALVVDGGVGIGKNLYVSGSTWLYGDLNIFGSSSVTNISSSTGNVLL